MTPEDRLTHVLQAEASKVDSDTQWADVERGLANRRRGRRLRQAALSTVAAAALVAGVLAVVTDDDRQSSLRVVPPATQPESPTKVPQAVSVPETVVVQRGNGDVVELSSADGKVVRVLLPGNRDPRSTMIRGTVSMPTARDAVYTARDGRIVRIELPSGVTEDLGPGDSPSVSPNGVHLVHVADSGRTIEPGRTARRDHMVLRAARHDERIWWEAPLPEPRMAPSEIQRLDWAADGRFIAMETGWEDALEVSVFAHEGELRPMTVPQGNMIYSDPVYLGASLVVLANDDADYAAPTPNRIVSIDPETGRITATLVRGLFGWPAAADASGQHLLYIRGDGDSSVLYRLTDGKSFRIADDVVAADW